MKEEPEEDGELMDKEMASRYRGLVARANYLAQGRADLQFTTKEASRKIERYEEDQAAGQVVRGHGGGGLQDVHAGGVPQGHSGDWAGCLVSRKSTSGGVIALAGVILKSWSSTQGSIATSVGRPNITRL